MRKRGWDTNIKDFITEKMVLGERTLAIKKRLGYNIVSIFMACFGMSDKCRWKKRTDLWQRELLLCRTKDATVLRLTCKNCC